MTDIDKLMEFLQKEVPSNASDLMSSLNLCIQNIDTVRALLRDKSIELQKYYDDHSKLDESLKCTQANKMLLDLKGQLKGYINIGNEEVLYDKNETREDIDIEIDENNDNSFENKDDDEKYLTDQTIPYPLSEKLINTKPCKFSYRKTIYDVSSYKNMWIKLCEILYTKETKRFENIAKMKRLSGRGIPYITYKNDEAVKDIKDVDKRFVPFLDTDILIYTNMNIPQLIKIIEELLDMYKISPSSIKVYLKNDKNPRHGREPIGKYLDKTFDYKSVIKEKENNTKLDVERQPEIRIAQRAYDYFQEYFKNTYRDYDIQNFLDKEWCYKTFNISYPVFKQVDNTLPLKEQTFTDDKKYAHYNQSKQVIINGKSYMIYMRWNPKHRVKLEKWIIENPVPIPIVDATKKILSSKFKHKCTHYDFKKDLCGNVDNPLFNQPCDNVSYCKYYSENTIYVTHRTNMKSKLCLSCGGSSEYEYIEVSYTPNNDTASIVKKLQVLRCNHCNKFFISTDLYRSFISHKDSEYIDVKFTEFQQ